EVINEQYPTKDNNKLVWQNMKFAGGIVVPTEELADRLLQFINCNCEHLRIGTSTSRGLGKVRITATAPQKDNSLENRLHKFQAALENRAQMWQQAISNNKEILETHRFYFVVGLQSDAILEENWHKTMVVSPTMLASYANIADPSLKLHTAYSSYSYRSGWNSAWGLLKDVELVTNKGSVYLFSCDKAMMGEWLGRLQILEMVGIGRRTVEGFGQMRVSDEFHSVFREEVV
ncbi:MAG: CRISPR-associated RAMP protein Csx10, partial [Pseudanabaenaceae cyanobacterium]